MQILEDEAERLFLRLADQKTLEGVENKALTLGRSQIRPGIIAHPDSKGPGKKRQLCKQLLIAQSQQLSGDPFANLLFAIATLDLEISTQKIDQWKIRCRLAVRHRSSLENQPALHVG